MTIYSAIIVACWALFILVWGIMAFNTKSANGSAWRGFGIRALLVLVVILIGGWHFTNVFSALHFIPSAHTTLAAVGAVLGILGIGLAIWSRLYLGSNWGMPRTVKVDPELVTTGPYAYVRHPIYTGVILAMIGTGLVAGLWWLIPMGAYAIYFAYSARVEEQTMLQRFPDTYPAYKARSKMLIPFIF